MPMEKKKRVAGTAASSREEYRVFISYSHEDPDRVRKIVQALRANGLDPVWDEGFVGGTGFPEQIKTYIAHAHVFLPLITPKSSERGWVHQEIGYASAMNVPVLPVTIGTPPEGIIRTIHAIRLGVRLENARKKLTWDLIDRMANEQSTERPPLYECAADNRQRAVLTAQYAERVATMGRHALLRQKGALTSLHIPDRHPRHRTWLQRYGGAPRDSEYCRCLRRERRALERHAREAGCRLVIDPFLSYRKDGPQSRPARLSVLLEFLESVPDKKCQVALYSSKRRHESVTILGDYFFSRAVSAKQGSGYEQTIFTRHAPTIRARIEEFDDEFRELLVECGWKPEESRRKAIELLRKEIRKTGFVRG